MSDPLPDPVSAPLSRAEIKGLMAAAGLAVERLDTGLGIMNNQPAQPPAETQAWREKLVLVALEPVHSLWVAHEPAQLRDAGLHLFLALLREFTERSASNFAKMRQFQSPPPPAEAVSPAPGSGPQ